MNNVFFKIEMMKLFLLLIAVNILSSVGFPQTNISSLNSEERVELSEKDISDIISCFRTKNPSNSVENFKLKMPNSVTDEKVREKILQNLPQVVKKLQINDSKIINSFRKVIAPVLELYGRLAVYEIIVIKHKTPIMFSDTGIALVVTTGMIERAEYDDDILGFVAHEVAHEYFAKASINVRYVIGLTEKENEYRALTRKYWESMALIELQCDGFSALTLAALGKNPLAFIEEIEKVETEYPNQVGKFYPVPTIRRRIVEGILLTKPTFQSKVSNELEKLKKMLEP